MTIELEEARELLKRAVETQGRDFKYTTRRDDDCFYEALSVGSQRRIDDHPVQADDPRTQTACLIGVALDLAGETRHRGTELSVTGLRSMYQDMLSEDSAYYLQQAQRVQDQGGTWGQALDKAEAWYEWRTTPTGPASDDVQIPGDENG